VPAPERLPAPDGGVTDALREGELKVEGRLTDASNATLYCVATLGDGDEQRSVSCVYKPIAGESPLWDFPDGTLAAREVAAYEVSAALGWNLVPETVMRGGPFGPGMCQRWIDVADGDEEDAHDAPETIRLLSILPANAKAGDLAGWCPIMTVDLDNGEQGILVHADNEPLRRVALFDVVINNADRKGGHLLPDADGHVYAIDHGVTFHTDDKLRTLLWGFADRPLNDSEIDDLKRLHADDALADRVTALLTEQETAAMHARIAALLADGRFPNPAGRRRPIPWPIL
jgi:uncharacterized repeat protein (TIGR03843 family)